MQNMAAVRELGRPLRGAAARGRGARLMPPPAAAEDARRRCRRGDARADRPALPDLPHHHRRRRARDACASSASRSPLEMHEVPTGTPVFDWTVPREWNIRDAWVANSRGERVDRLPRAQPPRRELQRAGPRHACASPSSGRTCTPTPRTPTGSPTAPATTRRTGASACRTRDLEALPEDRLRGGDRLHARRRRADLRRMPRARRDRGRRGADLRPRLPPLARQRQPLGHRGGDRARSAGCSRGQPPAQLPLPLHPRHHRLDHLAGAERGPARRHPPRPGRWPTSATRAAALQAQPPRRRRRSTARRRTCSAGRGAHRLVDFSPYGYDERQYCSPGFDLPVGCLSRTPYGQFPEYHTSADDLDLVRPEALADSLDDLRGDRRACSSATGPTCNLSPEGRAAARPARPLRRDRRPLRRQGRGRWRCSGC